MGNNDSQGPAGPGAVKGRLLSTSTMMTIVFCSLYFLMYLDRVNIAMAAKSIIKDFNLYTSSLAWPFRPSPGHT